MWNSEWRCLKMQNYTSDVFFTVWSHLAQKSISVDVWRLVGLLRDTQMSRLSAIQKTSKSPRAPEYVITLKFYRWTLSRKTKHRPMTSACCLSLSLCCIHIFHRLKCFSHSWKLLERDVRERKESGRWELRPQKKKRRSSLTTLHSLFFHCVSLCMHFLSSVILFNSPPFPPSFCHCCL